MEYLLTISPITQTRYKVSTEQISTYLSYISSVPCNEAKLGCTGNSLFNLSASAKKSHPLDEISPGTT